MRRNDCISTLPARSKIDKQLPLMALTVSPLTVSKIKTDGSECDRCTGTSGSLISILTSLQLWNNMWNHDALAAFTLHTECRTNCWVFGLKFNLLTPQSSENLEQIWVIQTSTKLLQLLISGKNGIKNYYIPYIWFFLYTFTHYS